MRTRNDILNEIEVKLAKKRKAEAELRCWQKGKYKDSSQAQMSEILVNSWDNELQALYKELEKTQK